ncbi:hypothetical protein PV05_02663 [Exophiala xenobiotica]|uniref:Uncharacterized protein n=1 Tax=Exophiala xenobiotica TaxID=348802 RepID=A0A0D2EQZ4_9EURO|nr:uncharacterized protein PV05_02663 [Exophiala xenobiotica]KIW58113.1 hypothetical protein PV05_02663 [Exophiala xenobiotica]
MRCFISFPTSSQSFSPFHPPSIIIFRLEQDPQTPYHTHHSYILHPYITKPGHNLKMSLTTTLTLPLRGVRPKSLTLDPIFTVLYENNEQALSQLVYNRAPLPLDTVVQNPTFLEYLLTKEPGPGIEYDKLRPAVSALRGYLVMSSYGKQLLDFYRASLQYQGQWIVAAAEQCAFEIWAKLVQALFIDRNDKQLLTSIIKIIPNAAVDLWTNDFINHNQFNTLVVNEQARLRRATQEAGHRLYLFKTSTNFWNQHCKLVASIEHCEKKLQELRNRAAERKSKREEGARTVCMQNEGNLHRQMGMAGMTPHLPHVEDSVVDWVKETKNDLFNFDDLMDEPIDFDQPINGAALDMDGIDEFFQFPPMF